MNYFKHYISLIGHPFAEAVLYLGGIVQILTSIIFNLGYSLKKFHLIVKEIYFSGVHSLIIVAISGWFVGMVLGLQGYNTLNRFGSISMLGSVVALSLLRELGPVLTAILFAARAGSGITAEISIMKTTEQLEAMNVMAVDPIKRIAAPKFLGGIIALPILTTLFNTTGILGAYFVGISLFQLDAGTFWSQMNDSVSLQYDIINGIIKSIVFGISVTLIAIYQGFIAKPTAEGASLATTGTVVYSALTILFIDFILTALMF